MENIPARNMNPPEMPEAPRCPSCDVPMVDKRKIGMPANWVCENPLCADTDLKGQALINALDIVIAKRDRRIEQLGARVAELRDALRDCLAVIEHPNSIDFSNGVVAPDGSDEGTVRGNEFLLKTVKKSAAALGPRP